jgi:hypothetical protein
MRFSNHAARLAAGAAGAAVAITLATGCSSPPAASSAPSARPTPVVTPDPHLTEPATADQVFGAIRMGDLPLLVNNATAGGPASPIVKQINAAIADWPLVISEYRTSALLRETTLWDPAIPPVAGDPPYAFVGLNILVEFGPRNGGLVTPGATRQQQAEDLVALIEPLLWPLEQRSIVPVATRTAVPEAAASVAVSASPAP